MFELNNGVAKIDGTRGKYREDTVKNSSVRYGRNSVQNFYEYMEQPIIKDNNATPPILDFGLSPDAAEKNIQQMEKYTKENDEYLKALPPLEYEYRYMPNINKADGIDKNALFGAAYEEMGERKEISIKELDKAVGLDGNSSAELMDIDKNGKIDIGEYSTSILAADMFSNDAGKIDGVITNKGHNAVQELMKKSNSEAAAMLYKGLYDGFKLESSKEFKPEG